MKKCCRCKKTKPFTEFHKDSRMPDKCFTRCKQCRREDKYELEAQRLRHKNTPKEIRKAWWANYRKNNPEKMKLWAKNNKEWINNYYRERHKQYPYLSTYNQGFNFSKKRNRAPKWLTKEQKLQIFQFYKKAYKLQQLTKIKMSVDHIIPLNGKIVSGLHVPWNLQVLTYKENALKNNKF